MTSIAQQTTAVVLTFNEEDNLARTLDRLTWAPSVLVVDSGSTDATLTIAAAYPNTRVVTRPFDTFAGQCNFALTYRIYDKPLRGTLYPPRTVLYRREQARYRDYGHGHAVEIDGAVRDLSGKIFHDDRKPLSRWFASQAKYARQEADYLLTTPRDQLGFADRVRLTVVLAPVLVPLHTLFLKGCILDGPAGWHYALQRLLAETMIALEIIDRRLRP